MRIRHQLRKNQAMKRGGGVLFSLLLVIAAITAPFHAGRAQAATHYAAGIDVSVYQGVIDWQAVKDDGVQFAMIRVGSHKKGIDTQFAANMQGANAVGLRAGVYYYSCAASARTAPPPPRWTRPGRMRILC